jgi:hypothetical protein
MPRGASMLVLVLVLLALPLGESLECYVDSGYVK